MDKLIDLRGYVYNLWELAHDRGVVTDGGGRLYVPEICAVGFDLDAILNAYVNSVMPELHASELDYVLAVFWRSKGTPRDGYRFDYVARKLDDVSRIEMQSVGELPVHYEKSIEAEHVEELFKREIALLTSINDVAYWSSMFIDQNKILGDQEVFEEFLRREYDLWEKMKDKEIIIS